MHIDDMASENDQAEQKPSDDRVTVNCDQEAWIKDRIFTAVAMATALKRTSRVGADHPARDCGIEGVVNGTAVEIIRMLGMKPSYVNLDRAE